MVFSPIPSLAFLCKQAPPHYWLFQDMKINPLPDSNLKARQKWFDERKGKYIDTFYYEGEIKTMMRGGGNHMLSGKVQDTSNTNTSQTDVIRDEVRHLRKRSQ